MPPDVTLSKELLPWSEMMLGSDERSSTLPVPLTWKKLRPEGFEARCAEVDFPSGVGVEEDDVIGRAGERGNVREVDFARCSGAVGPAGAAGLNRNTGAAWGRQGSHSGKRHHGAAAGRKIRPVNGQPRRWR